jgi:hypothetical protein
MRDRVLRANAILNTHSTAVSVKDGLGLDKDNKPVTLNESLITTEINRLQTEWNGQSYARSRAEEYPSIADQLDDIYHNGIDAWKATIKTTKDKYPKP